MNSNICFAFSIHKAGSTLFYNLLRRAMDRAQELGIANRMRYVSIPDNLFNSGVPEKVLMEPDFPQKHKLTFDEDNTLYGGFRFVPAFANDAFLAGKRTMVLVRDPRDALTSLYYSVKKSHRVPVGEAGTRMENARAQALAMGVDEFILFTVRQNQWSTRFARLGEIRNMGKAWRYEDVVFDKARWLDEILAYLDMDLPASIRAEIVSAEDIRPDQENAESHIRQVAPGDHKRKLKAETIEELNRVFRSTFDAWGYH
jgi:hypothetical protein